MRVGHHCSLRHKSWIKTLVDSPVHVFNSRGLGAGWGEWLPVCSLRRDSLKHRLSYRALCFGHSGARFRRKIQWGTSACAFASLRQDWAMHLINISWQDENESKMNQLKVLPTVGEYALQWRRHGGNGGSGPPLLFRPLLRFEQIRWEVFYI